MKVKLTDICQPKQWQTISTDMLRQSGYPVYGANGIIGYYDKYNHADPTLMITCRGATCGTINVSEPFSYINGNAMSLDNLSKDILINYLYYQLINYDFKKVISGSAQPQITREGLGKVWIELHSLKEQKIIAHNLDKIACLIEKRKQQLEKLDLLVKSKFIEMFGHPQINEKGFPLLTVEDVIDFQGGSQPDKKFFEYEKTESNIRLIQIRDYKTDKFVTYIPKSMAKRYCNADDIMIGRYGPPIFQILQGLEGAFNVALMKATPKMGNKEFVRNFLKQDCLLHYLEGLSKRTAGQDGIQMDKLKQYPFPYPPIELQEQFARFAEQIKKSESILKQSLEKLETLKKVYVQKYFG